MGYAFHKLEKRENLRFVEKAGNFVSVRMAYLTVRKGRNQVFLRTRILCRSSLFKLLDHFYFYDNMKECYASIEEEDLSMLRSALAFKKKYSVWRKGWKILETKGVEEAWKFYEEKAQLFRMIGEMKNENK